MAKILMVNVPYAGHTNPTLPLAKELIRRGHMVFYVNAEEFRVKIEKTGSKFVPYKNYPEKPTENQKKRYVFVLLMILLFKSMKNSICLFTKCFLSRICHCREIGNSLCKAVCTTGME